MSEIYTTGTGYSVEIHDRISYLADQISINRKISPLIVVVDDEGPYILEGSHRIEALHRLKVKSFPALVVIDMENKRLDD